MRTVDDLVAWLRAQLDDDAATFAALDSTALNGIDSTAGWDARAYVERMPAEVDAKRRILDAFTTAQASEESEYDGGYTIGLLTTLRLLALPYADRPGYREDWRP